METDDAPGPATASGQQPSDAAGSSSDAGELPEGFFDDPEKDARARQVEYRDPAEVEWDKFQREMQSAEAESEQILDEDQQEATVGRQIEDVDDQIRALSRVVCLEKRKEELVTEEREAGMGEEGDSSADEAEVEEFLDWRSKKAWK